MPLCFRSSPPPNRSSPPTSRKPASLSARCSSPKTCQICKSTSTVSGPSGTPAGAGGIGRAFDAAPSFGRSLRAGLDEMAQTSPRQAINHSFIELSSGTVLLDFHGASPFFQRLAAKDADKRFGFGHESNEGSAGRNHGADFWCQFPRRRGNLAANLRNTWRRRRSRHGLPPQHETNEPRTGQRGTDLHEVPNGRASARRACPAGDLSDSSIELRTRCGTLQAGHKLFNVTIVHGTPPPTDAVFPSPADSGTRPFAAAPRAPKRSLEMSGPSANAARRSRVTRHRAGSKLPKPTSATRRLPRPVQRPRAPLPRRSTLRGGGLGFATNRPPHSVPHERRKVWARAAVCAVQPGGQTPNAPRLRPGSSIAGCSTPSGTTAADIGGTVRPATSDRASPSIR